MTTMILSILHRRMDRIRASRKCARCLSFEKFESRTLLTAVTNDPVTAEFQVQFRMEVTDAAGSQIGAVKPGDEFAVNVYVTDQRSLPQGVFAAYLDLVFDQSLVERTGSVIFGQSYTNALASGGIAPGILDEVGAVASLFDSNHQAVTPADSLLFRVPFRAINTGPVTFLTEPADHFPDSYVLLFGINQPVDLSEIKFDSRTLEITNPATPTLPATLNPAPWDFDSAARYGSPSSWQDLLGETRWSRPVSTLPQNPDSSLVEMPLHSAMQSHDRDGPDEIYESWRSFDGLPLDWRSSLNFRTTFDDSNGIDLPFILFPNSARSKQSQSPGHRFWLQSREHSSDDVPRDDSLGADSKLRSNAGVPDRKRTFLRINWTDRDPLSANSSGILASRMMDIDEIFAQPQVLDVLDVKSSELIAEAVGSGSKDATQDSTGAVPRIQDQLQAARGTSLAVEVGVGTEKVQSDPRLPSIGNEPVKEVDVHPTETHPEPKQLPNGPI